MRQSQWFRRLRYTPAMAMLAALAGCQSIPVSPSSSTLGETEWVLIEYWPAPGNGQVREVPLNHYTLALAKDGSLNAKLDCNNGTGSWSSTAAAADRGTIAFGPIAATRALCPDGSLGEMLAADFPRMTVWSLYDGRLTLGPAGEGPRYVWDRID